MKRLLIWGAGDQGTVTLDAALAMQRYGDVEFLDIKEKGRRQIPGYRVYEEEKVDLEFFLRNYDEVVVAVGNNGLRETRLVRLTDLGIPLATVIHPSAVISPSVSIAGGCTILACAVVNPNASVGTGCIINTGAIVEHDCVVGDFVNICPGVSLAGHTRLGKRTFMGIGSTVIDGVKVGKDAVVGAGAVVIRDVPDGAIVVGVPARSK